METEVNKMTWKTRLSEPKKPKTGDRVICIVNHTRKLGNKSDNNGYGSGWSEGRIFTIDRMDYDIAWPDDDNGCGVYADCIEVL